MRPTRRERRYLSRRGSSKNLETTYSDNKNSEHSTKIAAQISSFFNIITGLFKNGIPVAVKKLHYPAWAFYPFFFLRGDMDTRFALNAIIHERIHIRQQSEIIWSLLIPFIVIGYFFGFEWLLLLIYTPTLMYYFEWVIRKIQHRRESFREVRKYVSFEREATQHCMNEQYLYNRTLFSWLRYTGIKRLNSYGSNTHK